MLNNLFPYFDTWDREYLYFTDLTSDVSYLSNTSFDQVLKGLEGCQYPVLQINLKQYYCA